MSICVISQSVPKVKVPVLMRLQIRIVQECCSHPRFQASLRVNERSIFEGKARQGLQKQASAPESSAVVLEFKLIAL